MTEQRAKPESISLREIFEILFIWFVVWLVLSFGGGMVLGEASRSFAYYVFSPLCLVGLLIHCIMRRKSSVRS